LVKEYATPAGSLTARVSKSDDWPYGNHIPFLDDFIIPRARKPLIASPEDLERLRYLLVPPTDDIIRSFREESRRAKAFAGERNLLVSAGLGVGADMAGWLCGLQNLIYLTADAPAFVEDLMRLIASWNMQRMEVVLDAGIDLWVRRGWYENCDFWSPHLYRQFILPYLKREVELAHSAGIKFGYIMTSGVMPLLDMLLEAGVDVLIGVDPLMGRADLRLMTEKVTGRMCLWGGVNAALTVEKGSPEEVQEAVKQALDILSPGHGFILSPVDEIDDPSEHAWNNVQVFIKAWKEWRGHEDFDHRRYRVSRQ
jgi:uroporphyrinogen decarboxylase